LKNSWEFLRLSRFKRRFQKISQPRICINPNRLHLLLLTCFTLDHSLYPTEFYSVIIVIETMSALVDQPYQPQQTQQRRQRVAAAEPEPEAARPRFRTSRDIFFQLKWDEALNGMTNVLTSFRGYKDSQDLKSGFESPLSLSLNHFLFTLLSNHFVYIPVFSRSVFCAFLDRQAIAFLSSSRFSLWRSRLINLCIFRRHLHSRL
jgi:hypothetical protein